MVKVSRKSRCRIVISFARHKVEVGMPQVRPRPEASPSLRSFLGGFGLKCVADATSCLVLMKI
jgi:hypothetical protein